MLRLPEWDQPFILPTDASDKRIGAVFMQEHEGCLYIAAGLRKQKVDRHRDKVQRGRERVPSHRLGHEEGFRVPARPTLRRRDQSSATLLIAEVGQQSFDAMGATTSTILDQHEGNPRKRQSCSRLSLPLSGAINTFISSNLVGIGKSRFFERKIRGVRFVSVNCSSVNRRSFEFCS